MIVDTANKFLWAKRGSSCVLPIRRRCPAGLSLFEYKKIRNGKKLYAHT